VWYGALDSPFNQFTYKELAMYVEKVLYLCRHGETESNKRKTVQGWEEPLNLQGTFQAHRLAARLAETSLAAEIPIQKIYCSSMMRALQTANLLSVPLGLVPTPTRYLAEVTHPTHLQGVATSDPAFLAYGKERARVFAEGNVQVSDEETFAMAHARAKKVLRFLLDGPEQRVVVVTHGMFLTYLINTIRHGDDFTPAMFLRSSEMFGNCAVAKVEYGTYKGYLRGGQKGWNVWTGDTSHLAK